MSPNTFKVVLLPSINQAGLIPTLKGHTYIHTHTCNKYVHIASITEVCKYKYHM